VERWELWSILPIAIHLASNLSYDKVTTAVMHRFLNFSLVLLFLVE